MVAEEHEEGPSHLCIATVHVPDVVIVLACSFLRTSLRGTSKPYRVVYGTYPAVDVHQQHH